MTTRILRVMTDQQLVSTFAQLGCAFEEHADADGENTMTVLLVELARRNPAGFRIRFPNGEELEVVRKRNLPLSSCHRR